ncbi:uncharacterized protein BYT42DRAFT_611437 [Radiomyces spectabilis]|uniref:uncharacterized protein n=1 Tax=Radiomyces spectabilis TaxID=64574 RepID=UPI00221F1F51|nr:uncharacterized protein BYT42DRAFT_611437 [Radiomyces spectabilis]KAI8388384.1 hypothetical protein BYT42DRAFT_611437 [Radiomyces spectabilis]
MSSAASSDETSWRRKLGGFLENDRTHLAVLGLTLLDTTFVMVQIIYTFFHECNSGSEPLHFSIAKHWFSDVLEWAEIISTGITCLFMLECLLCLVAFGPKYYLPGWPHWMLHIFDITVVTATFVMEIILRGKEREVAGLLIILRLWRVVKVTEAVAMGVSFSNHERNEALKDELEKSRHACEALEKELAKERRQRQLLEEQIQQQAQASS